MEEEDPSSSSSSTSTTVPAKPVCAPDTVPSSQETQPAPEKRVGCAHYKRRAKFVTPCCNKLYMCRYCHDEHETHYFNRKTVTQLICTECDTRQRVQAECEKCGVRFGKVGHVSQRRTVDPSSVQRCALVLPGPLIRANWGFWSFSLLHKCQSGSLVDHVNLLARPQYTCLVCNLFDDEDKNQYHCDGCGICRIGGKDRFFHCEVCNMCLPMQLKIDGHRVRIDSM